MKKFENYLKEWEQHFKENVTTSSELYAYYKAKDELFDIVYRITFDFRLGLISNKESYYFSDDEIPVFLQYLSETDAIEPKYIDTIFDLYESLKTIILDMVLLHYEKESTITYYMDNGDTLFIQHR